MKIAVLLGYVPGQRPRIQKRIELEKTLGEVHLICWDRGSKILTMPEAKGFTIHSKLIPAPNDPLRRLIPYARFSAYALKELKKIQPDVVHVQGLDILKIACKYKKTSNKPVRIIYEVADLHKLIIDEPKSLIKKIIRSYLVRADKKCTKDTDLLIVTSMKFIDSYFGRFVPENKILYFPNVPDLTVFESYKRKKDGPFTVGYVGIVRYKRQIRNMIDACTRCGIKMMFAGYEDGAQDITALCKDRADVEWFGRFDFDKSIAEIYGKCDVIYSVYDADLKNVRIALPNKMYESVCCELPIIVAKGTYLASLVTEWGVGVAVDHRKPEELARELERLSKDQEYYNSFVENCKKHKDEVDLQRYNKELFAAINKFAADADGMN